MSNNVQVSQIQTNSKSNLNFRLRLDVSGANLRIGDKINNPESGLDIDFEIAKTDTNTPNTSTITVWNMSDDTYNNIYSNADGVELYGAFGDDEYALMFRGYPEKVLKSKRVNMLTANQGFLQQSPGATRSGQSDNPTSMTLIDGKYLYEDANISKGYKGSINSKQIIKDCVETFGIPIGVMSENIDYININNHISRGRTVDVLNPICKRLNANYTINNGVFYLYSKNEVPASTVYGILLDSSNSNTPERQDDKFKLKTTTLIKKNKKKGIAGLKKTEIIKNINGFMIETMLLPFLLPGMWCECDFGILQGFKYIYKVKLFGNNYGTEGKTQVFVR